MTVDIDRLRAIGHLLNEGYAISDKSDIVLKAADEIERLREALAEVLRVNETEAGDDVKAWAGAMLNARAALAQEQGGSDDVR